MKKHFDNLQKLSKGEYSLEEVLELAGIVPIANANTQPRNEKEFAEDHVLSDVYEEEK